MDPATAAVAISALRPGGSLLIWIWAASRSVSRARTAASSRAMPEVAGGPVTGAIPGPDAISRSRVASAARDRQLYPCFLGLRRVDGKPKLAWQALLNAHPAA